LNVPHFNPDSKLFIDALDERRAGRGDQDTIDQMVRKLFAAIPAKVRISCRVADWLGATDLAAFRPYFAARGGVVVLGLETLSAQEQKEVLNAQGMSDRAADDFLAEAKSRGLDEFLGNPQNLIMLSDAMKDGEWPTSRKELFERSTQMLLSEPNLSQSGSQTGVFTADELRDAAGALCAARLISDVTGISLSEHEGNRGFPTYRSIGFLDQSRVRAALTRRVFTVGLRTRERGLRP
jgi:hypothetical protein